MRIYDKLGVFNRVELVLYALTHRKVEQGIAPCMPEAEEAIEMDGLTPKISPFAVSLKAN
jgi:hypothetical protein